MKKFKSFKNFYLASAAAICAVFAAIVYFAFPAPFAQAKDNSEYGAYAFYYEEFSVNMNVSSDRKIEIEEYLTVVYNGTSNTGFMRDIPVNGGELVKHVSVTEFINGKEVSVPYSVEPYDDDTYTYITANIGSSSLKSGMTCSLYSQIYLLPYESAGRQQRTRAQRNRSAGQARRTLGCKNTPARRLFERHLYSWRNRFRKRQTAYNPFGKRQKLRPTRKFSYGPRRRSDGKP